MKSARLCIFALSFFLTIAVVMFSLPSPAGELLTKARYRWSESDQGTAAVHYVMEIEKSLGGRVQSIRRVDPVNGTAHEIDMEYGYEYRVRVAGVDVRDVRGPWSVWSVVYAPEALPGG